MTKRKERNLIQDMDPSHPGDNSLADQTQTDDGTSAHEEETQASAEEPRYVKFTDVKLGDMLIGLDDHDSDCIEDGTKYEVKQNERGRLYIQCAEGEHYLDKDVDVHDYIRGLGAV